MQRRLKIVCALLFAMIWEEEMSFQQHGWETVPGPLRGRSSNQRKKKTIPYCDSELPFLHLSQLANERWRCIAMCRSFILRQSRSSTKRRPTETDWSEKKPEPVDTGTSTYQIRLGPGRELTYGRDTAYKIWCHVVHQWRQVLAWRQECQKRRVEK